MANRFELCMSAQRALLGAIAPEVRRIDIACVDFNIILTTVIDGPIHEETQELLEVALTEIIADFTDEYTCEARFERIDVPEIPPRPLGTYVYWRYEPGLPPNALASR